MDARFLAIAAVVLATTFDSGDTFVFFVGLYRSINYEFMIGVVP